MKFLSYPTKYESINIILSHYHLDHVVGISYLPMWLSNKEINIWGPSAKFYKKDPKDILTTLTTYPYFSKSVVNFSKKVNIYEYDLNGFLLNDINVHITEQIHTAPSFGITIEDKLHYATDTCIIDKTFLQSVNVELLLHECWEYEPSIKSHSSYFELQKMHEAHCPKTKLGLIHLNPSWNKSDYDILKNSLNDIFICYDNMIINL